MHHSHVSLGLEADHVRSLSREQRATRHVHVIAWRSMVKRA